MKYLEVVSLLTLKFLLLYDAMGYYFIYLLKHRSAGAYLKDHQVLEVTLSIQEKGNQPLKGGADGCERLNWRLAGMQNRRRILDLQLGISAESGVCRRDVGGK